jgi:hypothetical protein
MAESAGGAATGSALSKGPLASSAGNTNIQSATLGDWLKTNVMEPYGRFNKGTNMDIIKDWDKFGNNPETYGYAYNKLMSMNNGGGGSRTQAPQMVVNNYPRRR